MPAIGCHIAALGHKPVSTTGTVLEKKSATIGQMLQTTSELRVLEDTTRAPNSLGFPTIEQYILTEAAAGYKVAVINQSWIITYNG